MRVCKQIVENVCDEEEAHIAQIMAVMLVGWEAISMLSKEMLTLDSIGRVSGTPVVPNNIPFDCERLPSDGTSFLHP